MARARRPHFARTTSHFSAASVLTDAQSWQANGRIIRAPGAVCKLLTCRDVACNTTWRQQWPVSASPTDHTWVAVECIQMVGNWCWHRPDAYQKIMVFFSFGVCEIWRPFALFQPAIPVTHPETFHENASTADWHKPYTLVSSDTGVATNGDFHWAWSDWLWKAQAAQVTTPILKIHQNWRISGGLGRS